MDSTATYKARQFNLSNLQGISDETLEMHFKLYEGYVKETNKLNEKISEFVKGGKVDQEEFAEYSELNRRLGFEYNGMVLHEYYFDNLKSGGGTGDAEVTFCAHTVGGGGPGSAGAQHMSADVDWVNTGTLLLLFMEGSAAPVFVAPSQPGHYSYEDVPFFGMPKAPGIAIQLQVVLIPTSA